jgi:hypothetical protein
MKADMLRIYSFYGCRLQSELPLSLVPVCAAGPVAVTVIQGEVPEALPDPVWSTPFVSISGDGTVLVQVEAVGRFLVKSGRSITIQPHPGAAPAEIEAFLVGPVAGVLLHQRGVLPLHASCVEIDGAAIAIAGRVHSGKSTLAAALVRKGAVLMSDDICPVEFPVDAAPAVAPGSAGLRLWPDAREIFARDAPGWVPIRQGQAKQVGTANHTEVLAPRRLVAIVRLVLDNGVEPAVRRLRGPRSVAPLSGLVYRFRLGSALGRGEALFRDLMRLADGVPIFEMGRPAGFEHLESMAEAIFAAIGECV